MLQYLRSLTIGAALVFLASLTFFACSSQNAMVEDEVSMDLAAIEAVDLARNMDPTEPGLAKTEALLYRICYYEAKNGFGSEGGKLAFELDGQQIYLIIPPNAIPVEQYGNCCEIRVWAEKWQTDNGVVYYYECTPGGIQFKTPVTLVQPFSAGSNVEKLFWYNPATGRWVVSDSDKVVSGSASFEIDHFSKYAISD
jgi:hypothetical protein